MDSSVIAARAPTAAAPLTAANDEPTAWFDAARRGEMALPEVMNHAQSLHAAGHTGSAAALYATWIEHSGSPLRHVACFNRGTLLSAQGRDEEAQAA